MEPTDVLPEDWKCWVIDIFGTSAKVFALSRGRARYQVALSLREVDYVTTIGEAFRKMKCKRAPEYDIEAQCCGKEAVR
jgi:hypothetical protein